MLSSPDLDPQSVLSDHGDPGRRGSAAFVGHPWKTQPDRDRQLQQLVPLVCHRHEHQHPGPAACHDDDDDDDDGDDNIFFYFFY